MWSVCVCVCEREREFQQKMNKHKEFLIQYMQTYPDIVFRLTPPPYKKFPLEKTYITTLQTHKHTHTHTTST